VNLLETSHAGAQFGSASKSKVEENIKILSNLNQSLISFKSKTMYNNTPTHREANKRGKVQIEKHQSFVDF